MYVFLLLIKILLKSNDVTNNCWINTNVNFLNKQAIGHVIVLHSTIPPTMKSVKGRNSRIKGVCPAGNKPGAKVAWRHHSSYLPIWSSDQFLTDTSRGFGPIPPSSPEGKATHTAPRAPPPPPRYLSHALCGLRGWCIHLIPRLCSSIVLS